MSGASDASDVGLSIAEIVRAGLLATPKALPPVLLYDAAGSTLFERITELPEYYLTRVERALLEKEADTIADAVVARGGRISVIELGSGSADKTSVLLAAITRRTQNAVFYPVDVSAEALRLAVANVRAVVPGVRVEPIHATHSSALSRLSSVESQKLVVFIGSSMGNYSDPDATQLCLRVRQALRKGDRLLLGVDQIKSIPVVLRAYDDSAGVTAAFMKNVLSRINGELGGHFDASAFAYVATWDPEQSCVAMFLESSVDQHVRIDALDLVVPFAKGERLHLENSIKYDQARVARIVDGAGFELERSFTDADDIFALHLCQAIALR